ncbi:MAG: hypothetical protein NTW31_02605 [Bacteroidetes bacterium]|nr:hypothetical protein [Bacteroidota bacterium]
MKILKTVLPFLHFFILSNYIYCIKVELKTSPLNGTWVELSKRNDTIVFSPEYDGLNPIFNLKRGFRIADGYKLPDYYSGPYNFKLGQNSISVYWFISSGSFQTYYFDLIPEENKFKIGNFFKDPEKKKTESDTLIFIRIK